MFKKIIIIALYCFALLLCSCTQSEENNTANVNSEVSTDLSSETSEKIPDINMVCTEYNGRVNTVQEENGETYFSITDYHEDGMSYTYEFIVSKHPLFDNTDLIDEFKDLDVVKIYSFSSEPNHSDKIPAHIVIRVDEVGTTFYAIVTEVLNNQLILKGLDINSLNFRSFYIAHIKEYTELVFNGTEASFDEFSVGDLVSVRFTQGESEMYPSALNRTERIEILVKGYTDEVYDYDA